MAQKGSTHIRIRKKTKRRMDKLSKNKSDTYDSLLTAIFDDQERRRKLVFKHRAERLNKIGKRK